ncbi:MAG: hypothetical protein ABII00_16080 [Elusimicrobiota bacterium]
MARTRAVLGTFLLCASFAAPAASQEDYENLFDEIETEVEATDEGGAADVPPTALRKLRDGFEGTARLRGISHFYDNNAEGKDTRHHFLEAGIDFKLKLAERGNLFDANGWLEGATGPDMMGRVITPPRDTERARNWLEVAELYYTREFPKADVYLGRKKVPMGLCTLYSPSDRINPQDMNDPTAPKSMGVWQAGADAQVGRVSVSLIYMPVFQPSKYPSERSRWAGQSDPGDPSAVNFNYITSQGITMTDRYPKPAIGHTQVLMKAKTTLSGWDLFLAAFRGTSRQSVLRQDGPTLLLPIGPFASLSYAKEYVPLWHLSAGFSTTVKKLEVHGESLYQSGSRRRDDDFVNTTLGGTYKLDDIALKLGLDSISCDLEYAWEDIIRRQSHPGYAQSSEKSRSGRDTWLGRLEVKPSDELSVSVAFVYDRVDGGQSQAVGARYRIRSGLVLKTSLEFYGGPSDSNLGMWRKCDRWASQLEYSF